MVPWLTQRAAGGISPVASRGAFSRSMRLGATRGISMPNSFRQRAIFSVLMAFAMVYGMEVYNQALLAGGLEMGHLLEPFADMVPLMFAVIVLETLIGGKVAHRLTFRLLDASKVPALLVTVFMGAFTCWSVCISCRFLRMRKALRRLRSLLRAVLGWWPVHLGSGRAGAQKSTTCTREPRSCRSAMRSSVRRSTVAVLSQGCTAMRPRSMND